MKLKDHPKFPSKLVWVSAEQGQHAPSQHTPIKYLPEDMSQAIILDDIGPSSDRTGVVIIAKHPNGMTGMTVLSVGDKKLASNLLQTAQKFHEKRFEELREAEVTDEMLTALLSTLKFQLLGVLKRAAPPLISRLTFETSKRPVLLA